MAQAPLVKFSLKVDEGRVFRKRLEGWKKDLRDLRWAWGYVESGIVEYHRRIFDSEGGTSLVSGGQWKPLHELTVIARLHEAQVSQVPNYDYLSNSGEGPEGRILHWSHRLRNAMVGSPAGTGDSIRVARRQSFTYGVKNIPYAPLHQDGGTNQWGKHVAARKFLDYIGGPAVGLGILELALQARMGGSK